MEFENLLIEIDDGVAILTVNRPQSLNAFNSEALHELENALSKLGKDEAVKVVIVTGAGEKAFVAGADIKGLAAIDGPCQAGEFSRYAQSVLLMIEQMGKPFIAAVNGFALGGGMELALACDFIYASEKAKFGLPEVGLGILPGWGGTQNLPRLVGPQRAKEMIFTGRTITAQKAHAWGIVNEVVPPEELMPKALDTAKAIVQKSHLAVAMAKDAIVNGINMTKEDGFRYEASLFGLLFSTQDRKEGLAAFIEKRRPEFAGK